ncbi:MAG: YjbE family putative metal transport protein [Bdellovibrionales bacterium]
MDYASQFAALIQVLIIDLSLAADNAIVIGMAANGLPDKQRRKAVWLGLGAATAMRIVMALFAVQLLQVTGLMLAGGLLLLWVSWKMYREIISGSLSPHDKHKTHKHKPPAKTLRSAITQILIADVGMSLDNVLAVAGAARDHMVILAIGLILSIAMMGLAANATAKMLQRWPWLAWVGMLVVLFVALHMIWDGSKQVWPVMEGLLPAAK